MTKTIKHLLLDAVFFNETFLAYSVYTAVQKGIVTMDGDESEFYNSDLPFDEIQQAIDSDSLHLKQNSIKLYMVKHQNNYAMYLAKNEEEVRKLHFKLFRESVQRLVDATHKKLTTVFCERRKRNESFYNMQERAVSFPFFCGLMESKNKQKNIEKVG